MIDLASYFSGGGTNFEPPLELAQVKIDDDMDEYSEADIIFITDGNAPVSDRFTDKFNQWKEEKNVDVYSVLIDALFNTDRGLQVFSDEIHKLSDINNQLSNDEVAFNLFGDI